MLKARKSLRSTQQRSTRAIPSRVMHRPPPPPSIPVVGRRRPVVCLGMRRPRPSRAPAPASDYGRSRRACGPPPGACAQQQPGFSRASVPPTPFSASDVEMMVSDRLVPDRNVGLVLDICTGGADVGPNSMFSMSASVSFTTSMQVVPWHLQHIRYAAFRQDAPNQWPVGRRGWCGAFKTESPPASGPHASIPTRSQLRPLRFARRRGRGAGGVTCALGGRFPLSRGAAGILVRGAWGHRADL